MSEELKLTTGCMAQLVDVKGIEATGMEQDILGAINSVVEIEEVEYVYFMPLEGFDGKTFVITSNRVKAVEQPTTDDKSEA